jgi:hypothetical protein
MPTIAKGTEVSDDDYAPPAASLAANFAPAARASMR